MQTPIVLPLLDARADERLQRIAILLHKSLPETARLILEGNLERAFIGGTVARFIAPAAAVLTAEDSPPLPSFDDVEPEGDGDQPTDHHDFVVDEADGPGFLSLLLGEEEAAAIEETPASAAEAPVKEIPAEAPPVEETPAVSTTVYVVEEPEKVTLSGEDLRRFMEEHGLDRATMAGKLALKESTLGFYLRQKKLPVTTAAKLALLMKEPSAPPAPTVEIEPPPAAGDAQQPVAPVPVEPVIAVGGHSPDSTPVLEEGGGAAATDAKPASRARPDGVTLAAWMDAHVLDLPGAALILKLKESTIKVYRGYRAARREYLPATSVALMAAYDVEQGLA